MEWRRLARVTASLALASLAGRLPPTRPIDAGSLARLEQAIAAREYEATPNGDGLQAPNRVQGLRAYFDASGIRIANRLDPDGHALAALTLAGVGREDALAPVTRGELSHEGARVELRRPQLTEWYENRPEGIEQGFLLSARPEGAGALALELAVSDALPTLVDQALVFHSGPGRSLRYDGLRAADASGRALPARLELAGANHFRIVVDDAAATYPVAIDPIVTQTPDSVLVGDGFTDEIDPYHPGFGFSVTPAGDLNGDGYADLAISSPNYLDQGAVFIFLGGPNGIASGVNSSVASAMLRGTANGQEFGFSVASAGDVNGDGYGDLIVGAPTDNSSVATEGGRAFIFLGGPSGIASGDLTSATTVLEGTQTGGVNGNGIQAGGYFGWDVASAGDVNGDGYGDVLVGQPGYDTGTAVGGVFLFLGGPSGIASGLATSAPTRFTVAPGESAVYSSTLLPVFGTALASAGDVNGDGYGDVVIGAPSFQSSPPGAASAVFVYLGGPSGIPSTTTLGAATRILGSVAGYGSSVAGAGDTNGDGYDDVLVGGSNTALVYLGGATGIPSGTELTASTTLTSTIVGSLFGGQPTPPGAPWAHGGVASAGDVDGDGYADVIVGAQNFPSNPGGAVFLFRGRAGGIPSGTELTASATMAPPTGTFTGPKFGSALANAGDLNGDGFDDLVIGQSFAVPPGDNFFVGQAYVYLGGAFRLAGLASSQIVSDQASDEFAISAASAGDVNGDGYADLIVGAPLYDSGQSDEGAAFLFHGGPAGITSGGPGGAVTLLHGGQAGAQLGQGVASAGDVNGDGYADVIVGAPLWDGNTPDVGAAFVFLGGPAGVTSGSAASAAATLLGDQTDSRFGWSVASAGDVNGDARADVIVGAPFYNAGAGAAEGAAFVFLAGPTGIASVSASSGARLAGGGAVALCGISVASAGDVNGDGYSDVIVGAPGSGGTGAAGIFRGRASGIASASLSGASTVISGVSANSQFGWSVAGTGDMNADGFDDLAIGAPFSSTPGASFGYVFAGGASMPASLTAGNAALSFPGLALGVNVFGISAAGAGDLNGDGYADVLFGSATTSGTGSVLAVFGASVLGPSLRWFNLVETGTNDSFGFSVASAGDVNGDGLSDVLVGAPQLGSASPASLTLYYGGAGTGRSVLARQLRGDGSLVPIGPLGDAFDANGFAARVTLTSPGGPSRVRATVQACPESAAFGAPSCVVSQSAWLAVGPSALTRPVTLTVAGLPPSAPIRWRARTDYAPATGPLPALPAHGPWRTSDAQRPAFSLRTSGDADLDGVIDALDDCRFVSNPTQTDSGGLGAGSAPDGVGNACQCGDVSGDGVITPADVSLYRNALANPAAALSPAAQSRCVVLGGGAACDVVQVAALQRALHAPALAPITTSAAAQVCAVSLP
ncbi:MAG TPA: hypothetical protein VMR86_00140 [Myxococcota bacterium]|nr:hypothetical protein [Myxococcota bacterium]